MGVAGRVVIIVDTVVVVVIDAIIVVVAIKRACTCMACLDLVVL